MSDALRVDWDDGDINRMLEHLGNGLEKALRPAAQAAAQVLYDEARARVPVSSQGHWFYGTSAKAAPKGKKRSKAYWFEAGSLRNSIYQKHVPEQSNVVIQVYTISWRYKRDGRVPYGFMVEYGTSRSPGRPFIRPAYDAKSAYALKKAEEVLFKRLKELEHGGT